MSVPEYTPAEQEFGDIRDVPSNRALGPIRARLNFWYTSLLTVTLLLLGGSAYGLLSYSLRHEVDAALNWIARKEELTCKGN